MPMRLGSFEMPKRLVKDEASATPTYGRYIAEPLEAGYGRTLGNSLRRVLLSSLEGTAISTVRIEKAPHEFCAIPGVVEDVTDIILNLKKVLLKSHTRETHTLTLKKKGPGEVRAGDFVTDGKVDVLNPDLLIATLAEDGVLNLEAEARVGRGFCPAEGNKAEGEEIGRIPIDSIFSPVRRVNFTVGNTRVGNRTDYDRLTLEIWTDGRVTPDEALTMSAGILQRHLDLFVNFLNQPVEFDEPDRKKDEERERLRKILAMSVNEIELSVRAANCLNNANITTVGELAMKTDQEMLRYRNFGKKSLNEIKQKLQEMGLTLGMKFDPDLLTPPPAKGASGASTTKAE
jgi:DNA-directed RNA polymerase subunit alpha